MLVVLIILFIIFLPPVCYSRSIPLLRYHDCWLTFLFHLILMVMGNYKDKLSDVKIETFSHVSIFDLPFDDVAFLINLQHSSWEGQKVLLEGMFSLDQSKFWIMCRICVVYSNGNWSLPQTIMALFMQQMLAQCIAVNCKIVVFLLKQFSHWTIFFWFSKKPTESLGALCMHFYKCLYLILRFTWPKYFVAGIFSDLSCQRSYKFRIDLYQTMTNF